MNEPIAREANKEDKRTGHFWESRYKSQALLSEEALLSCMAYVDLNPVRAKMSETPEASEYTSIKERVTPQFTAEDVIKNTVNTEQPLLKVNFLIKPLLHFDGNATSEEQGGIPFSFDDYLMLVDWTGRIIREDKRGFIAHKLPPILDRLSIDRALWIESSSQFEARYQRQFQKRRRKSLLAIE